MTLTFNPNPRRAVVVSYTQTQVQGWVGSKDRVETNWRTDGRYPLLNISSTSQHGMITWSWLRFVSSVELTRYIKAAENKWSICNNIQWQIDHYSLILSGSLLAVTHPTDNTSRGLFLHSSDDQCDNVPHLCSFSLLRVASF